MTVGYEVELQGFDEQLKKFEQFHAIADRHLTKAMHQGTINTVSKIRPLTPVGVSGRLRNSIDSEVTREGPLSIVGTVGSTMKDEVYPEVMEFGRKPGSMPPPQALERWVRLKLGVPDGEVEGVAYVIARNIARRGIPGKKFMQRGWEASKAKFLTYFEAALNRITEDLSNGRN